MKISLHNLYGSLLENISKLALIGSQLYQRIFRLSKQFWKQRDVLLHMQTKRTPDLLQKTPFSQPENGAPRAPSKTPSKLLTKTLYHHLLKLRSRRHARIPHVRPAHSLILCSLLPLLSNGTHGNDTTHRDVTGAKSRTQKFIDFAELWSKQNLLHFLI